MILQAGNWITSRRCFYFCFSVYKCIYKNNKYTSIYILTIYNLPSDDCKIQVKNINQVLATGGNRIFIYNVCYCIIFLSLRISNMNILLVLYLSIELSS